MNLELKKQLEEIKNLRDNWFENSYGGVYGKVFDFKTIENAEKILNKIYSDIFEFELSPVPQNSLLIEISGFENLNSIDIEIFEDNVSIVIFKDLYDSDKIYRYDFKSLNNDIFNRIFDYLNKG